jgi:hypothetical protein
VDNAGEDGMMREQGASLIQWLGLAVAIFMLVAVLLPVFVPWRRPYPVASTHARMKMIETACEAYRYDCGVYPPDKANIKGVTLTSSKALAWYLTTAFRIKPNTGEQHADKDVGPYLDPSLVHASGDGFPELLDAWKRPIEYDNIRDDPAGFDDRGANDVREKKARNPQGFDLFTQPTPSEGKPITNWDGK